jgi:imidazolonepropionase-like amidohydrolase
MKMLNKPLLASCVGAVFLAVSAQGAVRADILIKNVTLYDGKGSPAVANANVLVKGDKIAQVSTGPIKAGSAKVIDGTGKYLVPGLIDTHIHLRGGHSGSVMQGSERKESFDVKSGTTALHGYLYSGVTSVYDSGNNAAFIFKMRADERAGKITSPRIFAAGGVIAVPNGYASGPTSLNATNWEQTQKELDAKITNEKPDMLKLIVERMGLYQNKYVPTLSVDLMKKVTDYAKSRGVRSTTHISTEQDAYEAMDAGTDAFAHPVLRAALNDSYIKRLADNKIPVSTTMVVFSNIARVADEPTIFDDPLFVATMTPQELETMKTVDRQRYITSGMSASFRMMMPFAKTNIKALHNGGVILALGTDRTLGPTVHQELELLADSGISPFDCIKIATYNAAFYLGHEKDLGSVEAGKLADLLLLKADPAASIKNFRAIDAVIKDGKKIDLAKLDLPVNHKK